MSEDPHSRKPVRSAIELAKRLDSIETRLERLLAQRPSASGNDDEMLLRLVQLESRVAAAQRASKTTMWIMLITTMLIPLAAIALIGLQVMQLKGTNNNLQDLLNTQTAQLNGIQGTIGNLNTAQPNAPISNTDIQAILKQMGPALGTLRKASDIQNDLLDELAGNPPKRGNRK